MERSVGKLVGGGVRRQCVDVVPKLQIYGQVYPTILNNLLDMSCDGRTDKRDDKSVIIWSPFGKQNKKECLTFGLVCFLLYNRIYILVFRCNGLFSISLMYYCVFIILV